MTDVTFADPENRLGRRSLKPHREPNVPSLRFRSCVSIMCGDTGRQDQPAYRRA